GRGAACGHAARPLRHRAGARFGRFPRRALRPGAVMGPVLAGAAGCWTRGGQALRSLIPETRSAPVKSRFLLAAAIIAAPAISFAQSQPAPAAAATQSED